jgi:hypothetical protein
MHSRSCAAISILLTVLAAQAFANDQKEDVTPIDSSIRRVSFSVVFKPEKRDTTYALLEKSGGQNFYLARSEVVMISKIEPATRGESILLVNDEFTGSAAREITVVRPSGKQVPSEDTNTDFTEWSSGKIITIQSPEPGNWHLTIRGAGGYSVRVTAKSQIAITGVDFVKLGGRPGHEGYFRTDSEPAIDA